MFNESAGGTEKLDHFKITKSLRFKNENNAYLFKNLTTQAATGGSLATTFNLTISADTNNYVLYDAAKSAGYDGYSLCTVNLTINNGIKVGSTSVYLPALDIRGFPTGCAITIFVNSGAYIVGAGGIGGVGGYQGTPGTNGTPGGDAIWTNGYVTISNNGTIAGGGGGGGGGGGDIGCSGPSSVSAYTYGGSGGGGAGLIAGTAGQGVYPGSNGTLTTGGLGSPEGSYQCNNYGGNGGDLGQAGTSGQQKYASAGWPLGGSGAYLAGSGGAAGNYVVGSNFVTWTVTGTRLGNTVGAANSKRWTVSFWCKRNKMGMSGLLQAGADPSPYYAGENIFFDAEDRIDWVNVVGGNPNSYYFWIRTTARFRDPNAWYHIVAVCDITNATESERLKIYVNGQRQAVEFYPGYAGYGINAGTVSRWGNSSYRQNIGKGYGYYFNGNLAEFHYVDGVALTPTSFGRTDYKTGEWIARKYTGGYGTYGTYLPFTDVRTYPNGNFYPVSLGFDQRQKVTRLTTPGAVIYTIPSYTNNITIEAWGAGGGGGAGRVGYGGGGLGQSTTVSIGSPHPIGTVNLIAGGGSGGSPGFSVGSGGTASGGAINTNGDNGSGNAGATAPSGGGPGGSTILNGAPGWAPGGGGAGGYDYGTGDGGGGGSGACVRKVFAVGDLTPGQTITIFVGAGGAGDPAYPNQGTWSGGRGGDGMVQITIDGNNLPINWYPYAIDLNSDVAYEKDFDSMIDSPSAFGNKTRPTGNYCVWNSVYPATSTIGYGGLSVAADGNRRAVGTMTVNKGKWYYEVRTGATTGTGYPIWGIHDLSHNKNVDGYPGAERDACWGVSIGPYTGDGYTRIYLNNNGSYTLTYLTSPDPSGVWETNDVIMIAFDADTGKFWAGRNGVWYKNSSGNRGDPATGTNPLTTYTVTSSSVFAPGGSVYDSSVSYANFGQQSFRGAYVSGSGNTYTGSGAPPSGFRSWSYANLTPPAIYKGKKYFDTVVRTGTGAPVTVTGLGFKPDFIWTKIRNDYGSNYLIDSVRGVTKILSSNSVVEETTGNIITAFNNDGYTVDASQNSSGKTYVDWIWRASGNTTANASGQNGASIGSTYSANKLGKFSIVTYTGNGQPGATIAHGLGVRPDFMIIKNRTSGALLSGSAQWPVYHKDQGVVNVPYLQEITPFYTRAGNFNNTLPTAQVFSVGGTGQTDSQNTNRINDNYVAYCWAEVPGFSKFGSFTGNGSAGATDGPFVYCGFKPRFILLKSVQTSNYWAIIDTSRNAGNVSNSELNPNLQVPELSTTGDGSTNIDILSNGFKLRGLVSNPNGAKVIFAAFAESPFKFASSR